jgi:hypothetical protein
MPMTEYIKKASIQEIVFYKSGSRPELVIFLIMFGSKNVEKRNNTNIER